MPSVSPTLLLIIVASATILAVVVSEVIELLNRRAIVRVMKPAGFHSILPPRDLASASASHLPNVGAASVVVRDVMALDNEVIFRCDYTLGSIRARHNQTCILRGRWDGQQLADVRTASKYETLLASAVRPTDAAAKDLSELP